MLKVTKKDINKDIKVIAIYSSYPFKPYYITKIDDYSGFINYYHDGVLYTAVINDDYTGFIDHFNELVPLNECIRTGTGFGLPAGTRLIDVITN